jgi:MtN3 and saliva related transmembrane protein
LASHGHRDHRRGLRRVLHHHFLFPSTEEMLETGETGDLSLLMFAVLTIGIALWVFYGFLRSDTVIITANFISLVPLLGILYFKLREIFSRKVSSR